MEVLQLNINNTAWHLERKFWWLAKLNIILFDKVEYKNINKTFNPVFFFLFSQNKNEDFLNVSACT